MSIYNEDELIAPTWINKEFLRKVLQEYEKQDNVEILDFTMTPASMKGDHYASIMFRCKVNYLLSSGMERNRFLIIKTIPEEQGMKRDLLAQSNVFETEISMYTKTLPKMEEILKQHGDSTKLCARIIYHSLQPHKVLIFEDLCELGYNTLRGGYPNEDELKAIYCKIAKIHAVSYMLGQTEEHNCVTQYKESMFNISAEMTRPVMANGLMNFKNMVNKHPEFLKYMEKIQTMEMEIISKSKELYDAYRNTNNNATADIFVLNHGDFHLKNLMFKHNPNTNAVEDLIFVDYQICIFAPSTIDLIYSQYSMMSPELRLSRHEWMRFYFEQFIATLRKIKYAGPMPKYSQCQMSNLKYRHFTLLLITTFLPMVSVLGKSAEELKDTDITKYFETPEMIADSYNSPKYINDLRQYLPILLNEGYLD